MTVSKNLVHDPLLGEVLKEPDPNFPYPNAPDYDVRTELTREEDHRERMATVCPGCGGAKDPGCTVCWGCFKYRKDVTPKKWSGTTLRQWLQEIGRPTLEEQRIL